MRLRRWVCLLGLAATLALGPSGCATCRDAAPVIEPSVSGRSSGGAGGFEQNGRVDFEVSNLFCRAPKPARKEESLRSPQADAAQ